MAVSSHSCRETERVLSQIFSRVRIAVKSQNFAFENPCYARRRFRGICNSVTIGKINITDALKNVETLLEQDKSASPQLRAMMELLVVIIHLLLGKLGLNSKNSSTPPSKDPRRPRSTNRKTSGEKRKPGGQNGHKGSTLEKVANPDKIETIEIDRRTLPRGRYTRVGFDARQVIDIKITAEVTEYRAEILENDNGKQFVATFPVGVTQPVQYGASVKAQAVYMSQSQLVPYERVRDYFTDQCGIPISAGSVFNFNKEAYTLLERFETIVVTIQHRWCDFHFEEIAPRGFYRFEPGRNLFKVKVVPPPQQWPASNLA